MSLRQGEGTKIKERGEAHGGELRGRTLLGRGGVLVTFLLRFGSVSLPEADARRDRGRKKRLREKRETLETRASRGDGSVWYASRGPCGRAARAYHGCLLGGLRGEGSEIDGAILDLLTDLSLVDQPQYSGREHR